MRVSYNNHVSELICKLDNVAIIQPYTGTGTGELLFVNPCNLQDVVELSRTEKRIELLKRK